MRRRRRTKKNQKQKKADLDADDGVAHGEEVAAFDAGAEPALDGDDAGQDRLVQLPVQFGLLRLAQKDLLVADLVVLAVQVHLAQEVGHVRLRTADPNAKKKKKNFVSLTKKNTNKLGSKTKSDRGDMS